MVHLQQPRLALVIQHDVDSEDLKAQRVLYVTRLRGLEHMFDVMNAGKQSFDTNALDLIPYCVRMRVWIRLLITLGISVLLINPIENARQAPLVAYIVMKCILVLLEVALLLIDCVVGQMHTQSI